MAVVSVTVTLRVTAVALLGTPWAPVTGSCRLPLGPSVCRPWTIVMNMHELHDEDVRILSPPRCINSFLVTGSLTLAFSNGCCNKELSMRSGIATFTLARVLMNPKDQCDGRER